MTNLIYTTYSESPDVNVGDILSISQYPNQWKNLRTGISITSLENISYNEINPINLINQIINLSKSTPNDGELGKVLRSLINPIIYD